MWIRKIKRSLFWYLPYFIRVKIVERKLRRLSPEQREECLIECGWRKWEGRNKTIFRKEDRRIEIIKGNGV